jgi:hypothetical protein
MPAPQTITIWQDMARGQRSICGRLNTNYTKRSRQLGHDKNLQLCQHRYAAVRWSSTDGCFCYFVGILLSAARLARTGPGTPTLAGGKLAKHLYCSKLLNQRNLVTTISHTLRFYSRCRRNTGESSVYRGACHAACDLDHIQLSGWSGNIEPASRWEGDVLAKRSL